MLIDMDDKFVHNALTGNKPISFVQGDTYHYVISFQQNSLAENISHLVFSCNKYNIEEDFTHTIEEDGTHVFTIELNDTENYAVGNTTYDVVAFVEDNLETYIFSESGIPFSVKKRMNPLKRYC